MFDVGHEFSFTSRLKNSPFSSSQALARVYHTPELSHLIVAKLRMSWNDGMHQAMDWLVKETLINP